MSLLFDKVRRTNPYEELKPFFDNAQVILASNISRYFFQENPKEYWYARDFPNVAPPFPYTWIECERPEFLLSEEHGRLVWNPELRPNRWGVAITALDTTQYSVPKLLTDQLEEQPKWILQALLYIQTTDDSLNDYRPIFTWLLPVNHDGTISQRNGEGKSLFSALPNRGEQASHAMRNEAEPLLHTALLALCFMHCSNVRVVNQEPHPRHSRLHQKTYHYPLINYKILEIEPMKHVLRSEGLSETRGIQHAMNICRGHFKHFGPQWNTGKLFGKHEGMFWWESQVRGSADKGIALKDYDIKRPKPV